MLIPQVDLKRLQGVNIPPSDLYSVQVFEPKKLVLDLGHCTICHVVTDHGICLAWVR